MTNDHPTFSEDPACYVLQTTERITVPDSLHSAVTHLRAATLQAIDSLQKNTPPSIAVTTFLEACARMSAATPDAAVLQRIVEDCFTRVSSVMSECLAERCTPPQEEPLLDEEATEISLSTFVRDELATLREGQEILAGLAVPPSPAPDILPMHRTLFGENVNLMNIREDLWRLSSGPIGTAVEAIRLLSSGAPPEVATDLLVERLSHSDTVTLVSHPVYKVLIDCFYRAIGADLVRRQRITFEEFVESISFKLERCLIDMQMLMGKADLGKQSGLNEREIEDLNTYVLENQGNSPFCSDRHLRDVFARLGLVPHFIDTRTKIGNMDTMTSRERHLTGLIAGTVRILSLAENEEDEWLCYRHLALNLSILYGATDTDQVQALVDEFWPIVCVGAQESRAILEECQTLVQLPGNAQQEDREKFRKRIRAFFANMQSASPASTQASPEDHVMGPHLQERSDCFIRFRENRLFRHPPRSLQERIRFPGNESTKEE